MTPAEVSAAAASIDVPVYILAAVAPMTRPENSVPMLPITLPSAQSGRPVAMDGWDDDVRERAGPCERGRPAARQRPPASICTGHCGRHRARVVLPAGQCQAWQIERKIHVAATWPGPQGPRPSDRPPRP